MKKYFDYLLFRCHLIAAAGWMLFFLAMVFLFGFLLSEIEISIWLAMIGPVAFAVGGMLLVYFFYWKPLKETRKILKLFAEGYYLQEIIELKYPLCPEMVKAMNKCRDIILGRDWIKHAQKQSEYLALQNQINPHFLYNTLEGIRGEALVAGVDSIAEMTEALATFFRYTISQMEHLVTLEDELENVENYFIIQRFRFGNRLHLKIEVNDYDEENDVMRYRLPKLTLQPLVENAVFHGIERKIGDGTVIIRIQPDTTHLNIIISDDGVGIEEDRLQRMNERLHKLEIHTDGENKSGSGSGIAIVNVNNRIKLLFGEEYGIHMYSLPGTGTDVEITLPLLEE